jgi:hypothetical protein
MAKNLKPLECFFCRKIVQVDAKTGATLCATCVSKLADAPVQPKPTVVVTAAEKKARKEERLAKTAATLAAKKTATKGKGRGWHLKELFAWEGEFYSFGQKISDAAVAKLKKKLKKGA